jgi:hypothetical protein
MASNFYGWLVDKLRYKRMGAGPMKLLTFGAIYQGPYSNWKHDPRPLIWVQWSDQNITHGINIHYLNRQDKQWLGRLIYIIKRAGQNIDPRSFFRLLSQQRPNIIKVAYRMYKTNLLNMKLVSAGITPLDKLIYSVSTDPWVAALNDMIRPGEVKNAPTKIAFSPTELQDRIIQATNTTDIRTKAVPTGPRAPYIGQSPFLR